jgi:hypothetical protein
VKVSGQIHTQGVSSLRKDFSVTRCIERRVGTAYSVVLATGWTVRGSNDCGDERPNLGTTEPPLLWLLGLPVTKTPGRGVDHATLSNS